MALVKLLLLAVLFNPSVHSATNTSQTMADEPTTAPTFPAPTCPPGFTGNGIDCHDFDECSATGLGRHDCDGNANCTNTDGGFTCTCRDGYSGNGKTCTDNPPEFVNTPCQSKISQVAVSGSTTAKVTWTNPPAIDPPNAAPTVTCTPPSDTPFAFGSYMITCTATDNAGGTAECMFEVEVTDFNECNATGSDRHDCDVNAVCTNNDGGFDCACRDGYSGNGKMCTDMDPPEIVSGTCPMSSNQVADPMSTTTVVTWTDPSATDSTGVPPTVTCTPASDSRFSIGSTTVTCNATDAAGNTAVTPCTFTVTVTDFDECNAVPSYPHNCHANANCINRDGGFTCACKDGYTGNGRTCQDMDPPVFNNTPCQSLVGDIADPMSTTTVVTWTDPLATDSTGVPPTVTCTPASDSRFSIGSTTVTCNANDAAGNTAVTPCTFTVTVTDFDECSASSSHPDDCDVNADCTNTDGGFNCSCRAGYRGDGKTCRGCDQGINYGMNCASQCSCVVGGMCNTVTGACSCDEVPDFPEAECDKNDLSVDLSVTETPVLDTSAIDTATLRCTVNLPAGDLMLPVTITKLPDGASMDATKTAEGIYDLMLNDIHREDSGTYICNVTTMIGGTPVQKTAEIDLDVLAPGRIINITERVEHTLGQNATVDCVVFARPAPNITWYDIYNNEIRKTNPEYTISRQLDMQQERLTSSLSVINLERGDNGTYKCETSNNLTVERDQREAAIIVTERPEVGTVNLRPVSAEEINVTWQVDFEGNLPYSCRVEYRKLDSLSWILTVLLPELVLSRHVSGLDAFTDYAVRVICRNDVGESLPTDPVTVKTLQGVPSAPGDVRVVSSTSNSFMLEWDVPDQTRGTIAYYEVTTTDTRTSAPKVDRTNEPRDPAPTSLEVTGLVPYRVYTIVVAAVNEEGGEVLRGDDSASITRRTDESTPSEPVDVQLDSESDICNVTWDRPEQENGIILSYTVFREAYTYPDPEGGGNSDPVRDQSKSDSVPDILAEERSYTVRKGDLEPYAQFRFAVLATTSPGPGKRSLETNTTCDSPATVPTEPIVRPAAVGYIDEETPVVTSESFWMSVDPANTRNGPISCYDIIVVELKEEESIVGKDPDMAYPNGNVVNYLDARDEAGIPYLAVVIKGRELTDRKLVEIGTTGTSTCDENQSRRKRQAQPSHMGGNGALKQNTRYTAFVRAFVRLGDGTEVYSSSPLMEPVRTLAGVNVPGVIIGVILAILIVVAIVLVGLIYVKRRKQTPLLRDNENGYSMEPVMREKEPELTHMVVPPILVEDLSEKFKQKSANDDEVFKNEFKSIPESTGTTTKVASQEEFNREKNRYINIVAYDETRVRLEPVDGVEGSDYINACYVDGYEKPKKFIAAQGPRDDTVLDFWRMIWEQNCSTIIMLTKCLENGREKCAEYWPEEDAIMYDDIIVTLDDVVTCADYVIRKFTMQKSIEGEEDEEPIVGERRTLMQFHFLGWPDFGIPKYPHSMLCFIKRIRHMVGSRVEPGNIVVHCSAGVGRTGTYILIDSMLDMMKKEKKVDIYNVIYSLRSQRNLLVQSLVQYVFIHKALMEEYLYGHTEVDVGSVHIYYQKLCAKKDDDITGVETEYRTVASLPVDSTEQKTGNIEANRQKNRLRQVIPYDKNRVKLERLTGQEHSNYINASFIDGYEHKKAYIAAQGPLPNTMGDFWRLAWENQCSTIVMLTECEEKGQPVCSKYWPDKGASENHAFLSVSVEEETEEAEYTVRDLKVSTSKGTGTKMIRQYHYHGWPELGTPESSASLVKVIGLAHDYQHDIGRFPVLIHCSAGSGRTGVFIALSYLLQRAKAEGLVDVFQTVRALRQQRPHMVQDSAQYQFCYRAMMEYLDSFDHYANFK